MAVQLGEIVKSRAGRDAGRLFVINRIVNEQYVLIVDGDLRKLERPKKKKLKHIEPSGVVLEELVPGLEGKGRKLNNADVRKAIEKFKNAVFEKGGLQFAQGRSN